MYEVTTARGVANAHLAQLRRGIMLTTPTRGDKTLTALTLPCEVTRLGSASFRIVLTEGRNQQIRRMCKALSLGEVKRLHRVSVAGINLDGLEGPRRVGGAGRAGAGARSRRSSTTSRTTLR